MMRNKKALFFALVSMVITVLYAKSNKAVEKYVHPRTYTLDLTDSETKPVFAYDGESLTMDLVFSQMLKDDMPRAGDRIKIVFSGWSTRDIGEFTARVYDRIPGSGKKNGFSYKLASEDEELLSDNVMRDVSFRGLNYFILSDDIDNALCLRITANYVDNPKKLNKTGVRFFRVTKSVNTTQELETIKSAEKKGWEIIEVQSDFSNDSDEDDEYDYDDYEDYDEDDVDEISDED